MGIGNSAQGNSALPSDNPDEVFDLINDNDQVIGQVRRGDAHQNPALLHRSVQVLVFDDMGRVLLQRRSHTKDLFPGYYCASASGHVTSGEAYDETAAREMEEELGLSLPLTYRAKLLIRSAYETEMTAIYLARSNGPFVFNPHETDGGQFFSLADIEAGRRTGELAMTPALLAALDTL